jgi:membrane-bound serine protease (ClpP class)
VSVDQTVLAAIAAVVVIFIVVGIVRAASRRRAPSEDQFGAGGIREVAVGSPGVAKTDLRPSGVVLAAGEEWTATSADGASIEEGRRVRVVGQDGLTLIVSAEPQVSAVSPVPPVPGGE